MALCSEWPDSWGEEEQGGGEGAASRLLSPSPPCFASSSSSSFSPSFSCSASRLLIEGRGTGRGGEGTSVFMQEAAVDAGAGPNAGLGGEGRAAGLAGGEEEEVVQEEEHGSWLSSVRYL